MNLDLFSEYSKHPDIDENVAVIVCGRHTKFIRHYSNQYEDIKHCLGIVSLQQDQLRNLEKLKKKFSSTEKVYINKPFLIFIQSMLRASSSYIQNLLYLFFKHHLILPILDDVEFGGPCPLTAAFLLSHGGLGNVNSISTIFVIHYLAHKQA